MNQTFITPNPHPNLDPNPHPNPNQSAAFLLHNDPLADVVRVHVDMDTAGQVVQHLRLPQFVQVLEVRRDGCDLPPRPFTTIRYDDELTLVGRPTVLSQCTAIKKGCARGKTNLP